MDTKRLYVDFHVLQTVPPSCVNRDDTGSPKTAVYGGATRRPGILSGVEARDPQNCLPKKWPTWSRLENVP